MSFADIMSNIFSNILLNDCYVIDNIVNNVDSKGNYHKTSCLLDSGSPSNYIIRETIKSLALMKN